PEEVYNNSSNHFVADFLGHSNFIDAIVEDTEKPYVKVKLNDGTDCFASPAVEFNKGDKAEMVIRAQKIILSYKQDYIKEDEMNCFFGKIVDRSYMGGEVSYFVELENKQVLHAISFVKRSPFKRGEEVCLKIDPYHCRLLEA
ncbi:MAG: TOBE domain-containing protein, partial [Desulfobacteraceae bacterium]|nr:TOBE domain-containing protein [Desulfobacteraceae bacterium]